MLWIQATTEYFFTRMSVHLQVEVCMSQQAEKAPLLVSQERKEQWDTWVK